MPGDDSKEALGRIALKQVRVSRAEAEARAEQRAREGNARTKTSNPMNRLVPYLDLFCRLSDEELSRLARAPVATVEGLRLQVDDVNRALGRFADLLPRLSDEELSRLSGASTKTIRFWRLSQPRNLQGESRRASNPDLTPAPQPLPRRESSAQRASASPREEDSSESSSRRAGAVSPEPALEPLDDTPDPGESATFVIDTVE